MGSSQEYEFPRSNNISPVVMLVFCTGFVDDGTSDYALQRLEKLNNIVNTAVGEKNELVLTKEDGVAMLYALGEIEDRITPCEIAPNSLSMLRQVQVFANTLTEGEKEVAA